MHMVQEETLSDVSCIVRSATSSARRVIAASMNCGFVTVMVIALITAMKIPRFVVRIVELSLSLNLRCLCLKTVSTTFGSHFSSLIRVRSIFAAHPKPNPNPSQIAFRVWCESGLEPSIQASRFKRVISSSLNFFISIVITLHWRNKLVSSSCA